MERRYYCFAIIVQLVGNKTKRVNLKTGVARKQSTPNFPKNEHFLPPDTHMYVCVSECKKCSFFVLPAKCLTLTFIFLSHFSPEINTVY